jgi:HD-GYP domain-containing protein (c-di-GMP phosphodiesterase class II)
MRRGALLHDIGAVVLADREMNQRGLLALGALDCVHAHPVVGYSLLKGVPSFESILPFVHRHHERIDGSGFPDGLRGSEISLPVQVVAIADAYDAMTSARSYRATFSRKGALETLREESGRGIWDPALIPALELAAPDPTPGVARVRGAARARRAGPGRARQIPQV